MKCVIVALLTALSLLAVPINALTVAAQAPRTLTGLLTVLRGDLRPGSGMAAQTRALLNTATGRYTLHLSTAQADALAGQMVVVTGVPQGDGLQVMAITGSDASPPPEFSTASVLGAQAYANLLCAFTETAHIQPKPLSCFTGLFGNTFGGLDHYWRQVSDQRMGLTGTRPFGWFTLPEPRFAYFVDQDLDGHAEFDLSPPAGRQTRGEGWGYPHAGSPVRARPSTMAVDKYPAENCTNSPGSTDNTRAPARP